MTRSLVVGTAGHIDHGKSALVLALTGTDPDRLKEEKARGITIELGFAHTRIGDVDVSFVDVPGHERFVRTMLAGAGGFDAVMLVVAADDGVRPQTREHLAICRLLGIERGLVALTKADLVDDDTAEIAAIDIRALVAGTFLEDAPIVPVSAKAGTGLDALRAALLSLPGGWLRQGRQGITRLPIDRAFTVSGFGTVVTGTLVSGAVAPGDELEIALDRRRVRVRGVHAHGAATDAATAPSRVAVNLAGVDVASAGRGQTLATPGALAVTRRADVKLRTIAPLKHGARVRAHAGTADIGARVAICAVRDDPRQPWRPARPGQAAMAVSGEGEAYVRLRFGEPVALTRGDRIVLRAFSPAVTIGGGAVLDPEPPSAGLRRPGTLDRFERLEALDTAIRTWLDEAADRGLARADLVRRAGLSLAQSEAALDGLAAAGLARVMGDRAYSNAFLTAVHARMSAALAAHHRRFPAEDGLSREALRDGAELTRAPELFDIILAALAERQVVRVGERIALAHHRASVSLDDTRVVDAVENAIRAGGLAPPELQALAVAAATSEDAAARAVHSLVKQKRVVRLGDIPFHAVALDRLKDQVRALTEVDIAAFKTRYGLSRKFAIPLLEWLDRERVTKRVGEKRVVLKP